MDWLAGNWLWIVLAFGVFLMVRHHGSMGRIHRRHRHGQATGDTAVALDRPARLNDPVSGEPVDPKRAINSTYQGHIYYFSSRENREKFEAAPARYATASATAGAPHRPSRHGC